MKIYKVYARGCFAAHPVKEITEAEAYDYISDEVIDSDLDYEEGMIKAEKHFEERNFFDCGDFRIVKADEEPSRGDCYGNSINDI